MSKKDLADHPNYYTVGIIGAGFSGICAAVRLQTQLKIDSLLLFDDQEDIGGTWLKNTYPGCECDIPSYLYSYSFEPNPGWSQLFSKQPEILNYLKNVVSKHQLYDKIKFRHSVISAKWDDTNWHWIVKVLNLKSNVEEIYAFDTIVIGTGPLREPQYPHLFDSFAQPKMHSAEWNSSITVDNKVVAVLGSGASAAQIIPAVVNKAKGLIVYQRSPPWVIPKPQLTIPNKLKWVLEYIPGVKSIMRNILFWTYDMFNAAFKTNTFLNKLAMKKARDHLIAQVSDLKKRNKLSPNYEFGCKRVIASNDYYPALTKSHVKIVTSEIIRVTNDTIFAADGSFEKPDVVITATGFKTQEFFAPLSIKGTDGVDLLNKWKEFGPCAYLGITCYSAPNAFFILGPNTILAHNSTILMIECQVEWMIQVMDEMIKRNARKAAVKISAENEYMQRINESMKSMVWGNGSFTSWYKSKSGDVTALWPESVKSYYNCTRKPIFSDIDFE